MWAKQKAFTIVELMVIIVVIGILAAISTVSYNGAQQRARDAKRVQDVDSIVTALTAIGVRTNPVLFDTSGAGLNDATVGFISTGPPTSGYTISIKDWLIQNQYLGEGINEPMYVYNSRDYAVTFCQDSDYVTNQKNRRVVMARLENVPSKTVDQQVVGNSCSGFWYTVFQGSPFFMNYAQVVDVQ